MKNEPDQSIRSVADLRARYPLFVKQIANEAAREERERLRQAYYATAPGEGGRLLMEAVIRANARRARTN